MQHITSVVDISAPIARVWNILTDFAAFPSWNPFVRSIVGSHTPGDELRIQVQPQGGRAMSFKPQLLIFNPENELRWKGKLAIPGLFDGEHYFQLSQQSGGTVKFTQGEIFSGLLVPLVFRGAMRHGTEQGFESMNQALKQRAERRE